MIDVPLTLILLSLAAVPLAWLLPRAWAMDGITAWTAGALLLLSPASAGWLVAASVLTPLVLRWGERFRSPVALGWAALLLGAFVAARLAPGLGWLGASFFTLRHLHVVCEWWMQRLPAPGLREHLRYQLFLPVLLVGPIHRIEHFNRQCARRRWEPAEFFGGAERVLVGSVMALVVGGWLVQAAARRTGEALAASDPFLRLWAVSAVEWVELYFVFAGLSAVALGTARMMGLRLEENFDRPWQATSLLEFWKRWHMTLSHWVQDYVFRPVMAASRNALLGLLAAMLAIGLWHEFSLYYVLWSFWQVLGVLVTRLAVRAGARWRVPARAAAVAGPLLVLAWLSAARPVILGLLQLLP